MPTELHFSAQPPDVADALVLVGRRARLLSPDVAARVPADVAALLPTLVEALQPRDTGAATSTWRSEGTPRRVIVAVLPDQASRHNSPGRPHALTALLSAHTPAEARVSLLVALDEPSHAFAAGCAVARAWPVYSRKSGGQKTRTFTATLLAPEGPVTALSAITHAAAAIREAARLVDQPTSELHTDAFVAAARAVAQDVGAEVTLLQGEAVRESGLGGLWGVGHIAGHPPALVVLSHRPAGATRKLCWVGKGIVYDTGGLSLKGKADMPGMKKDMAGAAAVLMAFSAAVKLGCKDELHAILCLAENAIGPDALRNDDILTMYSGKTVEVNNTDAEGRLVLADGLAWAIRHLSPDVMVDLATLTGAQLVATGKRHAAIVSNDEALETAAVHAGRASGDLVHPLPYCPEMFRGEFKSDVADLKNSVKDRSNAQSSCAAQFIAEHLGDYAGQWLHVDMAGPAETDGRGSGYGVGLLLALAGLA